MTWNSSSTMGKGTSGTSNGEAAAARFTVSSRGRNPMRSARILTVPALAAAREVHGEMRNRPCASVVTDAVDRPEGSSASTRVFGSGCWLALSRTVPERTCARSDAGAVIVATMGKAAARAARPVTRKAPVDSCVSANGRILKKSEHAAYLMREAPRRYPGASLSSWVLRAN
jgi:hypothetical protein